MFLDEVVFIFEGRTGVRIILIDKFFFGCR